MTEIETEAKLTRPEIAAFLREMADQLDDGGEVALELGGEGIALTPVEPVTFKLEGEVDRKPGESRAKESIELELVWWQEEAAGDAPGQ